MSKSITVRISQGRAYCSGVLIADDLQQHQDATTDLVLTCAHYFRGRSGEFTVGGAFFRAAVADYEIIPRSDLAVLRLNRYSPEKDLPALAVKRTRLGARTVTEGFGASWHRLQHRPGTAVFLMPVAFSRGFGTFVRWPVILRNSPPAVKGDSGGPVLIAGELYATQSLIMNVFGRSLGLATASQVAPMREQIQAAVDRLRAHV